MKKMMKTLLTILIPLTILSCGREAEVIPAPKSFNEEVAGLQAFSFEAGKMDSTVRAFTLLFYPRPEHIKDFSYEVDELSKPSWDAVLATLPYGDRVWREYPLDIDPDMKVQKMVAAIQSIGRSRDNAWREMYVYDTQMKSIGARQIEIQEEIKALEPIINWRDFTCFYKKRPRGDEKYECKVERDNQYRRRKNPRGCDDILTFQFIFDNPEDEQRVNEVVTLCEQVTPQLVKLEAEMESLRAEYDATYAKYEPLEFIRKAGESIVLDLLQTAERYTKEEGFPQVYVATGSSAEKPNNQDVLSEVKIDFQKILDQALLKEELERKMADPTVNSYEFAKLKEQHDAVVEYLAVGHIEKFSLWIEFGLNYSGGTRSQEYSIANGGIQDFELVFNDLSPAFNFKIVTDDFWIDCKLDVTNDDEAMGYRAVGEVFAHYPDGSVTRGGMKLEFNTLSSK